jgi:predicted kinase
MGPWAIVELARFSALVLGVVNTPPRRPLIVAIDGRSSSGKTTLARRLQETVPTAVTVHTDDVAWWHSCFGWADVLARGVLEPLRDGRSVAFRPPAWDERNRPGAIEVAADPALVIVEGVGAGRVETAHLIDGIVWVQSDVHVIEQRNAARIAAGEADADGVARWMNEEVPFLADQRPWARAFAVVAGTPQLTHDPERELILGKPPVVDHRSAE